MGFWQKIFGSRSAEDSGPKEIDHPFLGHIVKNRDGSWSADHVLWPHSKGRPSLSILGSNDGPAASGVATYRRIAEEWNSINSEIEAELFELNQNYFSESPSEALQSPSDIWGTAELLDITVSGDGNFSMTFVFDWQLPEDGHEVTVYCENWQSRGSSIDG